MIEDLLDIIRSRVFILGAVLMLLLAVLVHRLYDLQIVNGEDYLNTFTYRIQKDTELVSPRGTIFDCNGVPLAYNKLSYKITIEDSTLLTDNQTKNTMIASLIHFIESTGNTLIYDIPYRLDENGQMIFTAGTNTVLRFKKDVYSTENLSDAQVNADAQEVYEYMRSSKMFNLDPAYDTETALKILSVRFDLYMKRYEKYLSVEVATDVNDQLVAAVKENTDILPGVTVEQDYTRVYADSKYFSNITGYIGSISEDELAAYQESGNTSYSQNDLIGKTGIESYYESILKGTKGSQTLYVNSLGSVLETADTVNPIPGQNVNLTIDYNLQKAAYDLLEERIAGILLGYMVTDVDENNNPEKYIPAKDFYFALIDNNIISIDHLSSEEATDNEKYFWETYLSYYDQVTDQLPTQMNVRRSKLNDEYYTYIDLIYSMLRNNELLLPSSIDDGDPVIADWKNGDISFEDLVIHYITKNAVDLTKLELSGKYPDTGEIYQAIINYTEAHISESTDFIKKAYYYMLDKNEINGSMICLLLYDQNILERDSDYNNLVSGKLSAYDFMYSKIYNMEITPDMLALDPCSGSYILTDVKTGEVKALVSYPGYDANKVNNVSYFSSLVTSKSSPFFNKVTQQTLAPGSTYKPLVAIAGLEEGIIDEDYYIYDNVEYTKVQPHAYCWNAGGHEYVNVVSAIEFSCNYFFYDLGFNMGWNEKEKEMQNAQGLAVLRKYAELFGLNETSGLELSESDPHISDESCVRSAIGQGTNAYTASQLNRYITAVANSGKLLDLTLIGSITDSEGNIIETHQPEVEREIDVDQKTWDLVHRGMYLVCNESSYAEKMAGRGVTLAGKSGTAQESESRPPHALFVGYAPYEDPEVSAVLIIPNGHGSSKVLDLYADLMCYYYNLPMKNQKTDEETEEGETAVSKTGRHANLPDMNSSNTD